MVRMLSYLWMGNRNTRSRYQTLSRRPLFSTLFTFFKNFQLFFLLFRRIVNGVASPPALDFAEVFKDFIFELETVSMSRHVTIRSIIKPARPNPATTTTPTTTG